MKSDMIVFGEDWGAHPSSTQHIFKHLIQDRNVLWVNSIGLRRPKLALNDLKRLIAKGHFLLNRTRTKPSKCAVNVLAPKAIPWPGNPIAKFCNRRILAHQIKEKLHDIEISKPILWTSLPTAVDVLDQFNEKAVVYYCGDDFSALDGVDHAPVVECEKRLSEKADLIFVASDKLAEKFPTDKTYILPHGVDFETFSKPAPRSIECNANRPIAGFYGSIAPWVDLNLIAQTAYNMPHWDFMLVGPIKTDISPLRGLSNIKLIPAQPHEKLPGFVQHWQAALLPFKNTAQIRACNPLKLREYLASGTPVITTDFPALAPYKDYVEVIKTPDQLKQSLETASPKTNQAISVCQESWKNRARMVNELLCKWDQ